jgi:hypothetical protein
VETVSFIPAVVWRKMDTTAILHSIEVAIRVLQYDKTLSTTEKTYALELAKALIELCIRQQ